MPEAQQPSTASALRKILYGPTELRAGWRLLIFLAIVGALIWGSNHALSPLLRNVDSDSKFLLFELLDFLFFLLASWIMGLIERRTIGEYGLPGHQTFGLRFWQGTVLGFAAISALCGGLRLAGVFQVQGIALHGVAAAKWATLWSLVFLLVALREEFRARGYVLYTLAAGIGFWPAAFISAAIFGYSHHGNTGEDWIGLFNAGLFGLFACFLLRRTGNLWLPIGVHAAFDWGQTYFYGVADSGNVLPGHLLNTGARGPSWLSGGTVGPEGSILCTLLFLMLWALSALWLREVKYPSAQFRSVASPESQSASSPLGYSR